MDTERLQADIVSSLQSDPTTLEHLSSNADPQWTTSPDRLLRLDDSYMSWTQVTCNCVCFSTHMTIP